MINDTRNLILKNIRLSLDFVTLSLLNSVVVSTEGERPACSNNFRKFAASVGRSHKPKGVKVVVFLKKLKTCKVVYWEVQQGIFRGDTSGGLRESILGVGAFELPARRFYFDVVLIANCRFDGRMF